MRYASIDVLRTVALALMVVVHFMENLSGTPWPPGDAAAPLFTFLVGLSFRTWVLAQQARGRTDADLDRVAVRRGLFLFALGFAFNFFVWLPDDVFNWDVLTLIGIATLVLAFARGLPVWFLVFGCLVVFTLSPFLRIQADYLSYWENGYFDGDRTLSDILIGALATAYFPVFPWLVFPLAGYVVGTHVFPDPEDRTASAPSVRPLVFSGLGLIVSALVLLAIRSSLPDPVPAALLTGWTMFPASVEYVTVMLGITVLAFAVLHVWIDRREKLRRRPGLIAATRTMSQYALTIYLLHHAVHLWPLWICGEVAADEPTHYWRNALPVEAAVALAVCFLVVCYFFVRWMARQGRPSIESLMRWVCDERAAV
jgi:uncharacterized membrane protein